MSVKLDKLESDLIKKILFVKAETQFCLFLYINVLVDHETDPVYRQVVRNNFLSVHN